MECDFAALFINEMGWDNPPHATPVEVDESDLRTFAVAHKHCITAYVVECESGLPPRLEQHRVVRALKQQSRDQLVVFTAPAEHLWLWPEQRPSGVGYRLVDHRYPSGQPTQALLQRLKRASFKLEEESTLTDAEALNRVRHSFNADKITKSFYKEFRKHQQEFVRQIEGIDDSSDCGWYASLTLNRLMFVYFVQQKGFLDGDRHYLKSRLARVSEQSDRSDTYFSHFLVPLFHEGLGRHGDPSGPLARELIGTVPFVNSGIFEPHQLEKTYDIAVPDAAFEDLFNFFDQWRWHLDERHHGDDNEINPDVLGYIFEQYVNQKEYGAYYTKPDVTGYMSESAILPAISDHLESAGLESAAALLAGSGREYIREGLGHGANIEVPTGGGQLAMAMAQRRSCRVRRARSAGRRTGPAGGALVRCRSPQRAFRAPGRDLVRPGSRVDDQRCGHREP